MATTAASVTLRGVSYEAHVAVADNSLQLQLTDTSTQQSWSASFAANYVEEITKKTGHPQHFSDFVDMLHAAVRQERGDAVLDILTYSDLLALKSRRGKASSSAKWSGS